jgi:hypothetical protein
MPRRCAADNSAWLTRMHQHKLRNLLGLLDRSVTCNVQRRARFVSATERSVPVRRWTPCYPSAGVGLAHGC